MKSDNRKKEVRLRRNFFPTLMLILILWSLTAGLVYFVEPDGFFAIPVFFILVFLALVFTLSTIFANSRQGFIAAFGLISFLALCYLGVGNFLNFLLVLGLATVAEIYFGRS